MPRDDIKTAHDLVNLIKETGSEVIATPAGGSMTMQTAVSADTRRYDKDNTRVVVVDAYRTARLAVQGSMKPGQVTDAQLVRKSNGLAVARISKAAEKAINHTKFRQRTKITKLEEGAPA